MIKPGIKRPLVIKTSPRLVPVKHIRTKMITAYKFVIPHLQAVSQCAFITKCHAELVSASNKKADSCQLIAKKETLKQVQGDKNIVMTQSVDAESRPPLNSPLTKGGHRGVDFRLHGNDRNVQQTIMLG